MDSTWSDTAHKVMISLVATVGAWFMVQHAPAVSSVNTPTPPKRHHHRLRPWRDATVGGNYAPDGTVVQVDLPQELRIHNTGGRDGAGLCVFTSINMAAEWQNVTPLLDFQKWMKRHNGGGYPEKVDAMIKLKCKESGVSIPGYVQVEGADLSILDLALKTGRMASVTYGFSPSGRYGGSRISHMVSLVHADGKNYAVLDNNYVDKLEWLSREEFRRAYTRDGGWAVILLSSGPPPVPRNY